MSTRAARLTRMIKLLEVVKGAHQARISRLSIEEATATQHENEVLRLIAASNNLGLDLALSASRRLSSIARNRFEVEARRKTEVEQLMDTERRARSAERTLDRVEALMRDRAQRLILEELRLKPSRSSGSDKLRKRKV